MTTDFAEDFCRACEKEKEPYLIVYRVSNGGCIVRWSSENWEKSLKNIDKSIEEDIVSVVQSVVRPQNE